MRINTDNLKKEAERIIKELQVIKRIIIYNDDKEYIIEALERRLNKINKTNGNINNDWLSSTLSDIITEINEDTEWYYIFISLDIDIDYWNTVKRCCE